jgi:AAA ATPase domain
MGSTSSGKPANLQAKLIGRNVQINRNVQAALAQVICSIRARATRPMLSQLPRPPLRLIGREAQIAQMRAFLRRPGGEGPRVILVTGPSGIGKTALIISFAHSIKEQYRNGYLFVSSDPRLQDYGPSDETIMAIIDGPRRQLDERVIRRRSRNRGLRRGRIGHKRRALIIIDDIRDAEKAKVLLPRNASSLVIATSLNPITLDPNQLNINLGPITSEASLDLLGAIIGQKRLQQDVSAAQEIVRRAAGFPMALVIVGSSLVTRQYWVYGAPWRV